MLIELGNSDVNGSDRGCGAMVTLSGKKGYLIAVSTGIQNINESVLEGSVELKMLTSIAQNPMKYGSTKMLLKLYSYTDAVDAKVKIAIPASGTTHSSCILLELVAERAPQSTDI